MKVTPTASQQPICAKKRALPLTRSQLGKSKIQIKERRKHLTERTSDQYPGINKKAALKTCLSSQETSTKRRSTDAPNAQTPMSNH
jgi:hypothetical protein